MAQHDANPSQYIRAPRDDHALFSNTDPKASFSHLKAEKELTFHICTSSNVSTHVHDNYYEILIVTGGKLLHHFDGQTMVLQQADAFFLCPGEHHRLSTYKTHPSRHINLTCSREMAQRAFGIESISDPSVSSRKLHLSDIEFRVVTDLQESIFNAPSEAYQNGIVRILMTYLAQLFLLPERSLNLPQQMPKWLAEFIEQLQNLDFSVPVALSDLYRLSGKPQSTLSKQFKKYMGQTLVCYLNDLKLSRANNLLKSTSYSLLEISKASGFESYPHFSRLFKSKYGISPQQYRRTHPQSL